MDENAATTPEPPSATAPKDASGGATRFRAEAEKTVREIKGDSDVARLFDFEKMYFPFFGRTLFIVYFVLVMLVGVYMAAISFLFMFHESLFDGVWRLAVTFVFVVVAVVVGRVWIELAMVAFKINEAVHDIRDLLREKMR